MSKFILSLSIFATFFVPGLCSAQWTVNQSAVEHAARNYRIQIYHSLRTNRAEYDLRRQAGDRLLQAWQQAGKPEKFQENVVGWFDQAQQASLAEGLSPLPPQPELPKKTPAQVASDRGVLESGSDDSSDEPWGDLDFETENDSGHKTFISESANIDDAELDNHALLKDNSIENPFLTKPSVDSDRSPFVEEEPQAKDEPAKAPMTQEEWDNLLIAEPTETPAEENQPASSLQKEETPQSQPSGDRDSPFALEVAEEDPAEENPLVAPHLPKLPRMKVNDEAADSETADLKTVEASDPVDFLDPPTPLSLSPRAVKLNELLRQTRQKNIDSGKPATIDIKPGDAQPDQPKRRPGPDKIRADKPQVDQAKPKKTGKPKLMDWLNREMRKAVTRRLPQKRSQDQ